MTLWSGEKKGLKVSRKPDEDTSQHARLNRGVALITYLQREVFGFCEENDAQSKEREQPKITNQNLAADRQEHGQQAFYVVGERRKK